VRVDGRPTPFPRTTPEAPDLQRLLADMAVAGVDAVAMEVSSHGLDQHRVDGVRYDRAVFTNLSQDHLDYHASMDEYFVAKARLFTPGMSDGAVVNHDSREGRLLADSGLPTITYGLDSGADVRATEVETTQRGITFSVAGVRVASPLRGLFNVENCLAALATARSLGFDERATAEAISAVRGVPGRVEAVEAGQSFLVMVDYAHTPRRRERARRAPLATGRVIVVLGCGDRVRQRPLMGRTATASDLSVINDNPRSGTRAIVGRSCWRRGWRCVSGRPDRRAAVHRRLRGPPR
jgi:UDP-N-acetylmuramoyl-L-alanyl-D-glutamate--2,6-diaminopimelate ligase